VKAIVVVDRTAGVAGMKLVERPQPHAVINDVVVQVHASGFVATELAWPSTWTDRLDRDRTPAIPGHELAGVVTAVGYGTTGLSVGQRVFGLTDWYRDGTLAEFVAVEARNLAPLAGDVDFTVGPSLPISGLTAWQGLFVHGRLRTGQSVIAHGAAGAVGSMVAQLARLAGAYVIGTGRAADREGRTPADEHRHHLDPRRCRRRLQSDPARHRKDDHSPSRVIVGEKKMFTVGWRTQPSSG
jgi:NADPH:quinone reductase-like Zn-dependent oxidoreductase